MRWEDSLFLIILFCFSIFSVTSLDDIGVTYDENNFFTRVLIISNASLNSSERISAFTPQEHGSFPLLISSFFYKLTNDFLSTTNALRIGTIFVYLLFLLGFYYYIKKRFDPLTALLSCFVLMGMPQVFFHSHLVAHDFPVMVLMFASILFFYEALHTNKWWTIAGAGLTFGALLASKISGYIIFPILFFYALYFYLKNGKKSSVVKTSLMIGLLTGFFFLIISPAILQNPQAFWEYISYHGSRETTVFLFGNLYSQFSLMTIIFYLPITILTTINAFHVWFFLFGLINLWRNKEKSEVAKYLLILFLLLVLFFSSPFVFKGAGRRHFLALLPFVALFAGCGLRVAISTLKEIFQSKRSKKIIKIVVVSLTIGSSLFTLVYAHPFESSYFNILVGGTEGVAKSNMYTVTYWQDEFLYTLDWLNNLPFNTTISALPHHPVFKWYQREGLLRKDLNIDEKNVEYVVVPLRQSNVFYDFFFPGEEWGLYAGVEAVYAVKNKQGVELVKIFNMTALADEQTKALEEWYDEWDSYYEEKEKDYLVYNAYYSNLKK